MAERLKKVNIDDTVDGSHYECTCYSTTADAIPTTGNGGSGSYWELKVDGEVSYIGLWNSNATNTPPRQSNDTAKKGDGTTPLPVVTPLTIKKSGVVYNAMRYVLNTYTVTISPTTNQKIVFEYYGESNTKQTVNVTTQSVTVYPLAGSAYTCQIVPDTGYTKGALKGASANGYVTANMSISANAATKNGYVVSVNVPEGAIITVNGEDFVYNGETPSGTTTIEYGKQFTVSYASENAAHYTVSNLKVNGAAFTSGSSYTMPASAITITCTATVNQYIVRLEEGVGTKLTVTANGKTVVDNDVYNYGTVLNYSVADIENDAYENVTVTAGGI